MKVQELPIYLERSFTTFFDDFNYNKHSNQPIYIQEGGACQKYIYLTMTPYDDGLMVEFMLGLSHPKIEYQLSELLEKAFHGKHHLSYHLYPDALNSTLPKRQFIKDLSTLKTYGKLMEAFFVHTGFYWLDEFSQTKKLSDLLALTLIKGGSPDLNFKLSVLRSLLLKRQLGEQITEDLFFTYLELMEEKGLPKKEIRDYVQLKRYFIPHA